jgi:hypothetical protein
MPSRGESVTEGRVSVQRLGRRRNAGNPEAALPVPETMHSGPQSIATPSKKSSVSI